MNVALQGKDLKVLGVLILLLGITAASYVYFQRPEETPDRDAVEDYKAPAQEVERMYGALGLVMYRILGVFKRPTFQAAIILCVSAATAYGCFYFARPIRPASD